MENGNYTKAKEYYNRMINLNPPEQGEQDQGDITDLASLETKAAGHEKTLEGKLGYLAKSADAYEKIIAIDPTNASAKSNLKWIQDYQASVKKGINPNEIKGVSYKHSRSSNGLCISTG